MILSATTEKPPPPPMRYTHTQEKNYTHITITQPCATENHENHRKIFFLLLRKLSHITQKEKKKEQSKKKIFKT